MKKDEILKEMVAHYFDGADSFVVPRDEIKPLLDEYAMYIVRESVPEAVDATDGSYAHAAGWNSCRNETFEKARELINQPLKQNEN